MDSILKADIFFFVTTVAVVLLTALLATLLVYAIRILRTARDTSEIVKNTVRQVSQSVVGAQENVQDFLQKLNVIQLIRSAFGGKRKNVKKNKNEDHDTQE